MALPAIREAAEGLLLKVRANPGASRNAVRGLHNDALKVAVTAAPEKGKANQAIENVLAKALGLKRSDLRIHSGGTSREKWFIIQGVAVEELKSRLEALTPT